MGGRERGGGFSLYTYHASHGERVQGRFALRCHVKSAAEELYDHDVRDDEKQRDGKRAPLVTFM